LGIPLFPCHVGTLSVLSFELIKEYNSGQCLAVADEDGYLAFYDTRSQICGGPNMLWRAHDNAIFDIAWTCNDKQIVND
jgi:WD40 repeat protein